jgi:hypothetical protein
LPGGGRSGRGEPEKEMEPEICFSDTGCVTRGNETERAEEGKTSDG